MDTINNLVFIAILLTAVDTAYSLRCYNCSSTDPDRSCFDPIDINHIESTYCGSSDAETCVSLTAIGMETNSNNRIIARKYCAPKTSNNMCESVKAAMLLLRLNVTDCKSCEIDNCNALLPNWGNRNWPGQFVFVFAAMVLISRLILPKIIL